jgi:hypothetical protein
MCGHSAAMGGGTRDGVGGTPSFGKERRQPHSRIERSLSLSWFDRTAPESALSEMFVFDHTLNGFLLRVLVHPADISDDEGAGWLFAAHHQSFPRMREIRVDEG